MGVPKEDSAAALHTAACASSRAEASEQGGLLGTCACVCVRACVCACVCARMRVCARGVGAKASEQGGLLYTCGAQSHRGVVGRVELCAGEMRGGGRTQCSQMGSYCRVDLAERDGVWRQAYATWHGPGSFGSISGPSAWATRAWAAGQQFEEH